ncbi:hypothetical protein [Kiritimatiella glycovorans]|uniref:Tetratricopeptide repeat protein n=1 Tax=Kiritimatiella glycovorans TaxID=1307763 RepID=A0A0G3EGJ8_9BACT|nr:hypothetical protein [Kiritimatiella glycovorans]AKJ65468.1 hypothetical protein L21SP4_02241 [Kiritimatiella glycovorans]
MAKKDGCRRNRCLAGLTLLLLAGAVAVTGCRDREHKAASCQPPQIPAEELEVLDWGFRFATAIPTVRSYLVTRSDAQYEVLKTYLHHGLADEVESRLKDVGNWRRGQLYTDLAAHYARAGRRAAAEKNLDLARQFRDAIDGWQKTRITAHIGQVHSTLDHTEEAGRLETDLPEEESIRVTKQRIEDLAQREGVQSALDHMKAREDTESFEVRHAVVKGYADLLGHPDASSGTEAFSEITNRIEGLIAELPPLMRQQSLRRMAMRAFEGGSAEAGRAVLERAEEDLKSLPLNARFDIPLLVGLAQVWSEEADSPERAAVLMEDAAEILEQQAQKIRPIYRMEAITALAGGFASIGREDRARDYYGRVLDLAEKQNNGRPRARIVAELCASMGHYRLTLTEEFEGRLERMLAGLGEPW